MHPHTHDAPLITHRDALERQAHARVANFASAAAHAASAAPGGPSVAFAKSTSVGAPPSLFANFTYQSSARPQSADGAVNGSHSNAQGGGGGQQAAQRHFQPHHHNQHAQHGTSMQRPPVVPPNHHQPHDSTWSTGNQHQHQQQQQPPQQPPQQQQQQQQQQQRLTLPEDYIPKCPYPACPGVFTYCGANLRWVRRGTNSFWGCSSFPVCDYKYYPAQQADHPQIALELVTGDAVRAVPQAGAHGVRMGCAWGAHEHGRACTRAGFCMRSARRPNLVIDVLPHPPPQTTPPQLPRWRFVRRAACVLCCSVLGSIWGWS